MDVLFGGSCVVFNNVINSVSKSISVCSVEWNISVPTNLGVPFQDVLDLIYIYIYIPLL